MPVEIILNQEIKNFVSEPISTENVVKVHILAKFNYIKHVTWTSFHNFKAMWVQKHQECHTVGKTHCRKSQLKKSTEGA